MTRKRALLLGLLVLVVLVVVFRRELERAVLLTVTGWVVWRLVVGRTRARRPRSGWASWVEALSLAWIASRMPPRAKRERIDPDEVVPIGSLRPIYYGPGAPRLPKRSGSAQGDRIPF